MAALSYDGQASLKKFARQRRLTYPLLSDKGSRIIKALKVLDTRYGARHEIAYHMILVLDANGVVRHKFPEAAYRPGSGLETVLKAIGKGGA